ncbi:DUF2207 domain-containing protein, partial [Catenulispora sp. NF23]|uniref:DUF2207 domain-containing protein n=1 Tax=Catenulispora pinistramenti TaxID=2705254 RepID=UPI001BAD45D8
VSSPDGAPTDTAVEESDDQSSTITVGRAGTTITGPHTYDVDFTVDNDVFANVDEPGTATSLWHVVNNWDVPISDVEVTVTMPGAISGDQCRTGGLGAGGGCDSDTKDGSTLTLKQGHLDVDQQLVVQTSSALGSATL